MVPPAICQGPGCREVFSTAAGRSWRRVCTPWKRPAGLLAVMVTPAGLLLSR